MGQGKSPRYTHRLMHRKRVTSERHDSYFHLMTIKHAIPKTEWAIELLYNSVKTGSHRSQRQDVIGEATPGQRGPRDPNGVGDQRSWRQDVVEKSSTQQKAEPLGLRLSIRRTRTTHGYVLRGWWGQYVAVFVQSPTPSHMQTLQ